ncbi:MAG: hypothetical protein OXD38_12540, partial [Aestuariivita sp.]|nr:hypothetical protein [Aestuariivita sp.]
RGQHHPFQAEGLFLRAHAAIRTTGDPGQPRDTLQRLPGRAGRNGDLVHAPGFWHSRAKFTIRCQRGNDLPGVQSRKNTVPLSEHRLPDTHHVHPERQRLSYVGGL